MKNLVILIALIAAIPSAEGYTGIDDILANENVFRFSDGSSIYSFFSDGSFLLEPAGISGRAVEGTWTTDDYGIFTVTGTWTWYNGISAIDDFRRMTILITLQSVEPDTLESPWQGAGTMVYGVYFTVDELTPIPVP